MVVVVLVFWFSSFSFIINLVIIIICYHYRKIRLLLKCFVNCISLMGSSSRIMYRFWFRSSGYRITDFSSLCIKHIFESAQYQLERFWILVKLVILYSEILIFFWIGMRLLLLYSGYFRCWWLLLEFPWGGICLDLGRRFWLGKVYHKKRSFNWLDFNLQEDPETQSRNLS